MRISVLTPTQNRAGTFLTDLLASLHAQRLPGDWTIEHVIADDGSDALQHQELIALQSKFGFELVRLPVSSGVAAARNAAYQACSGDIIIDVDDDDLLPSCSIEDRVTHLIASDALWSFGRLLTVDEHLRYRIGADLAGGAPHADARDAVRAFITGTTFAWSGTRTYRREALDVAGPWDVTFRVGEDLEHWMRLSALAGPPAWCDRWLAIFRHKEHSLGIDALRTGEMATARVQATQRWQGFADTGAIPADLPKWAISGFE